MPVGMNPAAKEKTLVRTLFGKVMMMFRQKVLAVAGCLGIGAMLMGALPVMARPGTIDSIYFGVNLRSGPSLQASILDALPDGTPVEVLKIMHPEEKTYWYYIRSSGSLRTEGWVYGGYVRFDSTNQIYGTLAGDQNDVINLRSSPGLQGEVLHTGVMGDLVTVGRSARDQQGYRWYYITYPNQSAGWVREDLLSIWPKGCIVTCPAH